MRQQARLLSFCVAYPRVGGLTRRAKHRGVLAAWAAACAVGAQHANYGEN